MAGTYNDTILREVCDCIDDLDLIYAVSQQLYSKIHFPFSRSKLLVSAASMMLEINAIWSLLPGVDRWQNSSQWHRIKVIKEGGMSFPFSIGFVFVLVLVLGLG